MNIRSLFGKSKQSLERRDVILIIVAVIAFAAISLPTIANSSIWFDEAFSAYLIRFNLVEIWSYTSADVHPPLYYWLLKGWSLLFGTTDLALRSMSVLFGAIAIVFSYLILHRSFGRKAAIYGLIALVLSPILIRYSQEMRMYAMVVAIALAATYVLQRATEQGSRKLWITYGVLISLGMWTHYFAAIVWLAHWAWRALTIKKSSKSMKLKAFRLKFFTRDWVIAHIVAIGLFLPWLPFLIKQLVVVQAFGFWIPPVTPLTITNYFTNTVFYLDQKDLTPWLTLIFIVLVGVVIWLSVRGYKKLSKSQKPTYLLILALALVPPILLIITSMPPLQSSFIDRYLVTSSVAITLLLALALWFSTELKSKLIVIGIHFLVLGSLIVGVVSVYHYGNYNKINNNSSGAKQVMQQVLERASPGEAIIAGTPWVYYDAVFYATKQNSVWFIDQEKYEFGSLEMLRTQDLNKIKDKKAFILDQTTFWYIGQPGEGSLEAPIKGLEVLQSLRQSDPSTGKPSYQAIQYRVISE